MKTRILYGAMIALLGMHAMADGVSQRNVSQSNVNGKNVTYSNCQWVYIMGQGKVCTLDHPLPSLIEKMRPSSTVAPQPIQPHYVVPAQPKVSTNSVYDRSTGLQWQDNPDAKTVKRDWEGAKSYCENLTLDGYSDWRLPSKEELESIVDKSRTPAIKAEFKNIANPYPWYWSASPVVDNDSYAWFVSFYNGYTDYGTKTNKHSVRCVRGRQ